MTNEPHRQAPPPFRLPVIPIRLLAPNLVTLLALCSGLTSIRLAIEGRTELALWCIIVAAILDGVDGRLARMLKGTSKFGAELDSLTDFVNFGCAPALILYIWILDHAGNAGWLAVLVFAVCAALRLARFNVQLDDPDKPAWAANFFTGIPAPAGAICVLLPVYLVELGVPKSGVPAVLVLVYTLVIAGLLISRVPTFSGKKMGLAVGRDYVVPLMVGAAVFAGLLASYPWLVLSVSVLIYLAALPLTWRWHKRLAAADRRAAEPELPLPSSP
jgi:CDP-diacylglycerol--serine O-phosphatidyltransferase